MNGLKTDIVKDRNRIAYGCYQGENASLARLAAFGPLRPVTVDSTQHLSIGKLLTLRAKCQPNTAGVQAATIVDIPTQPQLHFLLQRL